MSLPLDGGGRCANKIVTIAVHGCYPQSVPPSDAAKLPSPAGASSPASGSLMLHNERYALHDPASGTLQLPKFSNSKDVRRDQLWMFLASQQVFLAFKRSLASSPSTWQFWGSQPVTSVYERALTEAFGEDL